MQQKIITISRQSSSGGREVGHKLAEALACPYYDKQLINQVAEQTGLSPEYIEQYSEAIASHNYPFSFGRAFITYNQTPSEQIQLAQLNLIKALAQKNPTAVIVGRAADYLLERNRTFRVFVYASDMDLRIARCYRQVPQDEEEVTPQQMQKQIARVDKQRAKYYEYYTGQKWGEPENYNLMVDTSVLGVEGAVQVILRALEVLPE